MNKAYCVPKNLNEKAIDIIRNNGIELTSSY